MEREMYEKEMNELNEKKKEATTMKEKLDKIAELYKKVNQ